ncbi:ectonucleoside triphosphate diphosphohydrolase 5/6 [Nematocida sp. LUAm3]|nr:ectonucleoside triphosphate diphosphohydrolase 5/6 [Nematocida sp. LUAm3]KAI5174865.1 ectonucleoside triphosphate diphosphohydrolase 5/6 [Nematocida sp. LUAm2]KAI5177537.1 ectonucleoside triphosphate diphosphohydrolase 5/6 [Nematocida sp. LUAm1]
MFMKMLWIACALFFLASSKESHKEPENIEVSLGKLSIEVQTAIGGVVQGLKCLQTLQKKIKDIALHIKEEEHAKEEKDKNQFIGVFDGGSTGTRLNIYKFDSKGYVLLAHALESVLPGIHESVSPEKDINFLFKKGEKFLLDNGHMSGYDFPVVFNGTAGLRLLESSKREDILKLVKKVLQEVTKKNEVEARVIDGKEEGFYAWAALTFITKIKEKIAIIDLGGGSAQISLEIDSDIPGMHDGVVRGRRRSVLSRSFLGMGLVSGLERIRKIDTHKVCEWKAENFDMEKCRKLIKISLNMMILEKTKGKEVSPGLSQVSTVFVSSFISEILNQYKDSVIKNKGTIEFQNIKNISNSVCSTRSLSSASNPVASENMPKSLPENPKRPVAKPQNLDCISVMYATMFMEALGVGLFTPIKDTATIPTDISWSLGRALSLLK